MTDLRRMYLCSLHPYDGTWKSVPGVMVPVVERMMNGRKISEEKMVLSSNTGMTAFPLRDFFLNTS